MRPDRPVLQEPSMPALIPKDWSFPSARCAGSRPDAGCKLSRETVYFPTMNTVPADTVRAQSGETSGSNFVVHFAKNLYRHGRTPKVRRSIVQTQLSRVTVSACLKWAGLLFSTARPTDTPEVIKGMLRAPHSMGAVPLLGQNCPPGAGRGVNGHPSASTRGTPQADAGDLPVLTGPGPLAGTAGCTPTKAAHKKIGQEG